MNVATPRIEVEKANPFRGLEPYDEKDQLYGRDSDLLILEDRVYSGRVTLLFSAPGAGKTSFLRAKAKPAFSGSFYCCYMREWGRWEVDPYESLLKSIAHATGTTYKSRQALCEMLSSFVITNPSRPDGL